MNKLKQLRIILSSSLGLRFSPVRQTNCRPLRILRSALSGLLCWGVLTTVLNAQGDADEPQNLSGSRKEELSLAPSTVAVQPVAADEEIRQRLQSVMEAAGWFNAPVVKVVDGVVFLDGRADTVEIKKWAGDLVRNTQDMVAVTNRIEVAGASAWDFSRARSGLSGLSREFDRSLPLIIFTLWILVLSAGAGWLTARLECAFGQGGGRFIQLGRNPGETGPPGQAGGGGGKPSEGRDQRPTCRQRQRRHQGLSKRSQKKMSHEQR